MLGSLITWAGRRLICLVVGHQLTPSRTYCGMTKSVEPGYRCERCGKTQLVLYRWQEVFTDDGE